jgi:hypothetical protein
VFSLLPTPIYDSVLVVKPRTLNFFAICAVG